MFDPRNIKDVDTTWEAVESLLARPVAEDADEDLRATLLKQADHLKVEWNRYRNIERCDVESHRDILPFWSQRDKSLHEAVLPYVCFPVSSACIESRLFPQHVGSFIHS